MKAKIENGAIKVEVNLMDLFVHRLNREERKQLQEQLSCFGDNVRSVTELLMDEMTESGYGGDRDTRMAINDARRKLLESVDHISIEHIRFLEREIKRHKEEIERIYLENSCNLSVR